MSSLPEMYELLVGENELLAVSNVVMSVSMPNVPTSSHEYDPETESLSSLLLRSALHSLSSIVVADAEVPHP